MLFSASFFVALTAILSCSGQWVLPRPKPFDDSSEEQESSEPVKFVLTFPAYYRATKDFAFNLVFFESPDYTLPVTFTATLSDSRRGQSLATQYFTQTAYGLQQHVFSDIKKLTGLKTQPSISIKFKGQPNLERHEFIDKEMNSLAEKFVFIQTDKAMYKPTQTVYFRVLCLNRELEPLNGRVSVTISDAKRNKIRMWTDQMLQRGVFGDSFTLSDFVNFGDWTVSVSGANMTSTTKRTFAVQQYVLPKYEAKLEFPNGYLLYSADDSTYHGYVRAKYTFGKPIRGKAVVSLIRDCSYGYHFVRWDIARERAIIDSLMEKTVNLAGDGSNDDGKFTLEGMNKIIFRGSESKMEQSNCNLVFKVNVTEELTGEVVSTGEQSFTLYRDRYKLKIHESVAKTIKPGLPFTMRLQVTQPDDSPITERVDVITHYRSSHTRSSCYSLPDDSQDNRKVVQSDEFGIVDINIDIPSNSETLVFKAFIRGSSENNQLCETRNVPRSRSNQAVSIKLNRPFSLSKSIPKVGDKLNIVVTTSFASDYVYILLAQNGQPFLYKKLGSPIKKSPTGTEYSIDVELPQESAPRCAAIAWTVENTAHEVLADAVEFKVDGLVRQSVSAEFTPALVQPGGSTQLKIKTSEPGSLVAMFAIDKSVKLLRSGNDITVDDVMSSVSTKTSNAYHPVAPLIWRCWGCGWWPCFVDNSNAESVFRGVGMFIKSNAHTDSKPEFRNHRLDYMYMSRPLMAEDMPSPDGAPVLLREMAAPRPTGSAPKALASAMPEEPEAPVVRMLFPETWFWSSVNTSSNAEHSQIFKAPDTITTWLLSAFAVGEQKGFGTLQNPAELTVFQPFFVNLDIPYATVIRGEQFAIKAVVFNYQSTPQTITLTLKKSLSFQISSDGGKTYASDTFKTTVSVRSNDGSSVSLWLKPLQLGEIILELEGVSTSTTPRSSDAMQKKILVEPEGEVRYANRPIFIRRENDVSEDSTTTTISVGEMFGSVPKSQVVDGSRFFQLQTMGDLLGPALTQLGSQIRLPTGCGEQTMVILAPNVYIYKYLKSVNSLTPELEEKTTSFVLQGYQRELTYQRSDGGFSAFGENDGSSSIWLTAFVMRCFQAATKYVKTPVDRAIVQRSWAFIRKNANTDGTFFEPGRVLHHDMKGGATNQLNLAAYIYTTYAEAGGDKQFVWPSLSATRSLLIAEAKNETATNGYQLALMAYATSILPEDRSISEELLGRLMSVAKIDADLRYWEMANGQHQSQIETAAYALLTLCNHNRLEDATSVARWLMTQRNSLGGFSSTQDTVVGLQALSEFAAMLSGVNMNLKIAATMNFADRGQSLVKEFMVIPSNAMLLQSFDLPRTRQALKNVEITISGTGVGLVQLTLKYNVLSKKLTDSGDFEIIVIEQFDARKKRSTDDSLASTLIKTCISPKTADAKSGMVVAEIGIPTGFEADLEQTKNLNPISRAVPLKRIELGDRKLVFYFDRTADATCVTSKLLRKSDVRNAQQPVARVYSYYEPTKEKSTLYTFSGLSEERQLQVEKPKPVEPENQGQGWFSKFADAILSLLGKICP